MKPIRIKSKKPTAKKDLNPKRWLLLIYLYLLIFINGMLVMITFAAITYQSKMQDASLLPVEYYAYAMALALANVFFLVNVLQKHRWAFWGFCLSTLGSIVLNILSGTKISAALLGLGGPIILFGLLYMGGRRSAWQKMSENPKASK